jgi:sugar lactone lactonase YvrE
MPRSLSLTLLAAAAAALPAAAAQAAPPKITTLATGLANPRHLDVAADGTIYVAEAGRGGKAPCFSAAEGPACFGATGGVRVIERSGKVRRLVSGLASYANVPGNVDAIGPHGLVADSTGVLLTTGGPTSLRTDKGVLLPREKLARTAKAADSFGRLVHVDRKGRIERIADVWAFEERKNPDRKKGNPAIDSNPVDVARDGTGYVVADAGGNALDAVSASGKVRALSIFPNRKTIFMGKAQDYQAVPTSVVAAPDGSLSVGQLTGFPFPVGGANVFRVNRRTGARSVLARGFTNIMDLAYAPNGTLYVLEIDRNGLVPPGSPEGAIIAVSKSGKQRAIDLRAGTLTAPGGIAVGRDGSLYVTNDSTDPAKGSVLRIRLG